MKVYNSPIALMKVRGSRIYIIPGGVENYSSKELGAVEASRLKDAKPGDRVSIAGEDFIVLRTQLSDLLSSMERGPQIITIKDSAAIIARCGICSGSRVIEVGAGSGALTISLAHAVALGGKIFSYEPNRKNLEIVQGNIRTFGMDGLVELRRETASDNVQETGVDAFIADVPEPWRLTIGACKALVAGGMACYYIPTMNQLEAAAKSLRDSGFRSVEAIEIIERGIEAREGAVRPKFEMLGHTGYLVFGRWVGFS